MKNKILAVIMIVLLVFVVSCRNKEGSEQPIETEQQTENQNTGDLFDEVLNGETPTEETTPSELDPVEETETQPEETEQTNEISYDDPSCGDRICTYYETYSSCPKDCKKLEDTTLNDYPEFLDDPILVVGDDATSTDVITATVISTYLIANDITPTTKLASEISSFSSDDLILIGTPCVNNAIASLLHYTSETCTDVINGQNNAVIKLLVSPTNEIILLTGYNEGDTKDASKMLTDTSNRYNLNGAEEWINMDSNGDINMYFSKN